MSSLLEGKIIVAGHTVGIWQGSGTPVTTGFKLRPVCIGGTEYNCGQVAKNNGKHCSRPHTGAGFKPSVNLQITDQQGKSSQILFHLQAVYKGEAPPENCDYVLFSRQRHLPQMNSGAKAHENTGVIVPYTAPTCAEFGNQPQLCTAAGSASNHARGWEQVSPVSGLKEPTLEEKRKAIAKTKALTAIDEELLVLAEDIEKLRVRASELNARRKQVESE